MTWVHWQTANIIVSIPSISLNLQRAVHNEVTWWLTDSCCHRVTLRGHTSSCTAEPVCQWLLCTLMICQSCIAVCLKARLLKLISALEAALTPERVAGCAQQLMELLPEERQVRSSQRVFQVHCNVTHHASVCTPLFLACTRSCCKWFCCCCCTRHRGEAVNWQTASIVKGAEGTSHLPIEQNYTHSCRRPVTSLLRTAP